MKPSPYLRSGSGERRPLRPQMVVPKTPQHPLMTQDEWRLRQQNDSRLILFRLLEWSVICAVFALGVWLMTQ